MSEIIFLVEEDSTAGGYTARALGSSIFTEGETWDDLVRNIREAISSHFDDPAKAPKVVRLPN